MSEKQLLIIADLQLSRKSFLTGNPARRDLILDCAKVNGLRTVYFFYVGVLVMKKMTIRKMLENIVVKTAGLDVKKFYLVSTDGEVATADFAIDLIWNLAEVSSMNLLWEVEVVAAKRVGDCVTVIFNPDIEQTNGDPDKNLW